MKFAEENEHIVERGARCSSAFSGGPAMLVAMLGLVGCVDWRTQQLSMVGMPRGGPEGWTLVDRCPLSRRSAPEIYDVTPTAEPGARLTAESGPR